MEPTHTPLPGASSPNVNSQTGGTKPLPPDTIAARRFCGKCAQYIQHPPFIVTRCCGEMYHDICVIANRNVIACSTCQQTPVLYARDLAFAEEVKKYDWSIFSPVAHDTDERYASIQASDDGADAREVGARVVIDGQSVIESNAEAQGLAEGLGRVHLTTEQVDEIIARGIFVQEQLDSIRPDARELTKANRQSGTSKLQQPASGSELASINRQCSSQLLVRPSEVLDIDGMTRSFGRLLAKPQTPGELEGLMTKPGYVFLYHASIQGMVPKWTQICNRVGDIPGKQIEIKNLDDTDAFFTAFEQHLDGLEPEYPFFTFFVCSRHDPVTGQQQEVSPVVRIFRHPTGNSLILLMTSVEPSVENPALGRLIFGSFEDGTHLVKYLKFLILVSEATQAVFVRPTKRGEDDAVGLDKIDVKGFIEKYPPKDMGGGQTAKSGKKILFFVAQSLGLKRIRKEDAKRIALLDDVISGDLRSSDLMADKLVNHLNGLGYRCDREEILTFPVTPAFMFGISMHLEASNVQKVRVQWQVAETLKMLHSSLPVGEKAYIQIQLSPAVPTLPEEILLLACDTDRLYLVNMKNKSISTQSSTGLDDICDYCQVFMGGCGTKEARISTFILAHKKKTRAR